MTQVSPRAKLLLKNETLSNVRFGIYWSGILIASQICRSGGEVTLKCEYIWYDIVVHVNGEETYSQKIFPDGQCWILKDSLRKSITVKRVITCFGVFSGIFSAQSRTQRKLKKRLSKGRRS